VRTHLAAVTIAGLGLLLTACGTTAEPVASAPSPTVPAATSAQPEPTTSSAAPSDTAASEAAPEEGEPAGGSGGGILGGKRQVVIVPVDSFESVVAVDEKGRLGLTDGPSDKTLFVLVPAGSGQHLIRTARAGSGGEPACMGLRDNGSAPATVVAAACDTSRPGQRFTIEKTGKKENDRPTYAIRADGDRYLRADRSGIVAGAARDTTFTLADNGAAPAGPGE